MYHYKPDVLTAFLTCGMAMFSLDEHENLSGFVKVDPWVKYYHEKPMDDGVHGSIATLKHIRDGLAMIQGFESGSLVVDPQHQGHNLATRLKDIMAISTIKQFPSVPIFSVVANSNKPSIRLNNKLGWIPITPDYAKNLTGIDFIHVDDWDSTIPTTIFVYPPSINGNRV